MTNYAAFLKKNGPASDCLPTPTGFEPSVAELVPPALTDLWQSVGVCAYAKGLLWVVDPNAFAASVREWFGAKSRMLVVARTAFADLFMLQGSRVVLLNPNVGRVANAAASLELFFSYTMARTEYVDGLCNRKHFNVAIRRLGQLKADECYGYFPAMALGGSGEPESLRRVGLFEHLSLLRQVTPLVGDS